MRAEVEQCPFQDLKRMPPAVEEVRKERGIVFQHPSHLGLGHVEKRDRLDVPAPALAGVFLQELDR